MSRLNSTYFIAPQAAEDDGHGSRLSVEMDRAKAFSFSASASLGRAKFGAGSNTNARYGVIWIEFNRLAILRFAWPSPNRFFNLPLQHVAPQVRIGRLHVLPHCGSLAPLPAWELCPDRQQCVR
jgi:hypothetical protein